MAAVFVIKRTEDGKFVFDIVNRNRVIASSAPYTTKALLQNQIAGISADAVIDDQSLRRRGPAAAAEPGASPASPRATAPARKGAATPAPVKAVPAKTAVKAVPAKPAVKAVPVPPAKAAATSSATRAARVAPARTARRARNAD